MEISPINTLEGSILLPGAVKQRRAPAPFSPSWTAALLLGDIIMFMASVIIVAATRFGIPALFDRRIGLGIAAIALIAVWLAFFKRLGLYERSFSTTFRDECYSTFTALTIGVAPLLLIFTIFPSISPSRSALLELYAVAAVSVSGARAALHSLRSNLARQAARRIAVIGHPARVDAVISELILTSQDEVLRLPVDDFDERMRLAMADGRFTDSNLDALAWMRSATEWGCDTLIATEALPPEIMPTLLRRTERLGIKFAFAPTKIRSQAYDFTLQKDGGLALICPRSLRICKPQVQLVRRIIDLALVIPAIIILSPLLALISLAVFIDAGSPVIYRQTRVGRYGREFEIFKFRSMPKDAEQATGPVWADPHRRRVTRIGGFLRRTSLDELPQLFNVLRNEMTLVGPRPERPYYVEKFRQQFPRYDERHLALPGITGWSQVHMKRVLSPSDVGEKLAYDLFYIEHWSLFMDASILVKTFFEFLFHKVA
ncbi:MAG TPA: sugar transferase [Candidatus Baltobacteraceae bacterium]|jgi:putative colanic acid biosynthesis UDP-glucose lipid carrier transferase|nr:sugar transferase [Candidatus Baltobacteraceae bacterium]